jgi:hypothetical protein
MAGRERVDTSAVLQSIAGPAPAAGSECGRSMRAFDIAVSAKQGADSVNSVLRILRMN